jgi:hypothetical protein
MMAKLRCADLLPQAWDFVKPYVTEAPALVFEEHNLLESTEAGAQMLRSPGSLFQYMSYAAPRSDGTIDPYSGFAISARMCKTEAYKAVPRERRLAEILDVTNILQCFTHLFGAKDAQVRDEYRALLATAKLRVPEDPFYKITSKNLLFRTFAEMVQYIETVCRQFSFTVALTKSMLEFFCAMMPSVIAKSQDLYGVFYPSYAYSGLLPLCPVVEDSSGQTVLLLSGLVSRCYGKIQAETFDESDLPPLADYMLYLLEQSLSGSLHGLFGPDSLFNNDIVGAESYSQAVNQFGLFNTYKFLGASISLYGYGPSTDAYAAFVSFGQGPEYLYITDRLLALNNPPLGLRPVKMTAVYDKDTVRLVTERERQKLVDMMENLRLIMSF